MATDGPALVIDEAGLDRVLEALRGSGFELVGPIVRERAIVYGPISSVADLPRGWTDEQDGGRYRLKKRADAALFGYAVGPHSWKQFLFPSKLSLWRARKDAGGFKIQGQGAPTRKLAFIGVRSCDLNAIAVQDRVFLKDRFKDTSYEARRDGSFVLALNCGVAGGTCFCVSMKTGPRAESGFDLAITELVGDGASEFVLETGSERGAAILEKVPHRIADERERDRARSIVEHTARNMGRTMDTSGIKELLYQNAEHPRWDDVASRCLACTNCTAVCPTCFCSTVTDSTDVAGENAERVRHWDSCFTTDFSYVAGGPVRSSGKSRYRQWMTHKLASWFDQFGTSGCVGCGRCITWCPVGIDITQEVAAIRAAPRHDPEVKAP